jgi:hypothetical protein
MRKYLIAIGLAVGLVAGNAGAASAATPARPLVTYNLGGASAVRKLPAVPELVFKSGHYRIISAVRPAGRFIIYSGPGVYLQGTRWTRWTAAAARATGQLWGVDARLVDLGSASIVLSAPKSHDGKMYYSALHIIGGKGVATSWLWYWSGPLIGWSPAG